MSDYTDDQVVARAVVQLAGVLDQTPSPRQFSTQPADALWLACQAVATATGIELIRPDTINQSTSVHAILTALAKVAQFRLREVKLTGQWWLTDNGPLLAFDQQTQQPLALLPNQASRYQVADGGGGNQPLTADRIEKLAPTGYMFYRSLPAEPLSWLNLLQFASYGRKQDMFGIGYLQLSIGLLALLVPIATGILLDRAVPNADISLLQQWLIGLFVGLLGTTSFSIVQQLLLLRLRFKTNAALQAAIWDRLLRLPLSFFRQFSAGDLTLRASGVDTIQQQLTGAILQTVLGGIFSVFTLALLFYYSIWLALVALLLLISILTSLWLYAWIQLHYQRQILQLQGRLASLTLQFLNGIQKLRVSHSEKRAFVLWVEQFARKNRLTFLAELWGIRFTLVRSLLMVAGTLAIYALVGMHLDNLSLGQFIAFNAAFGQFFAAMLAVGSVLTRLIRLVPLYERIQPILTALPEREIAGADPGVLAGKISLEAVNFRYRPEGPWVLENISLSIAAGEMVAFVGRTGCGKSTLFRLLLGFETPASGHILWGEQNLEELNLRALREQFGVVLQNSAVLPGTIFETIAGSYPLSLEGAWQAAEQAGLADDIRAMPMGMQTLLVESGKTLSTGQRQRLMIARALATKPRVLFLDEATSALDNPAQRHVMHSFRALNITRIIAAHRLSTVVHADKIYVLDQGSIVQSGNYAALMAEPGLFKKLVQRQLI